MGRCETTYPSLKEGALRLESALSLNLYLTQVDSSFYSILPFVGVGRAAQASSPVSCLSLQESVYSVCLSVSLLVTFPGRPC
jgi:hypothetical protein